MEEKKSNGISVSAFFLIIAIIVIIAMGYFIYKFYNDKANETKRANELQEQMDRLNGTVSELQGRINSVENTDNNSNNNIVSLNIGKYVLNEINLERDGHYYEDCGIDIKASNYFYINIGEGFGYSGKYKIENDRIICNADIYSGEYIEDKSTDVEFTFESVNDNTLKLTNININDLEQSSNAFSGCFEVGMTYSKKNDKASIQNDYEDIILNGNYMQGEAGDEVWSFSEDNKVSYSLVISNFKGTYKTIDRDMIEVHFTEEERDDFNNPPQKYTYTVDEYYKISIIDNNTIKIVGTDQELYKTTN